MRKGKKISDFIKKVTFLCSKAYFLLVHPNGTKNKKTKIYA